MPAPTKAQLTAATEAITSTADKAVDDSNDIPFFEKGPAKNALNALAPQLASAALTAALNVTES